MFFILASPLVSLMGKEPSIIHLSPLSFLFSTIRLVGMGSPSSFPPIGSSKTLVVRLRGPPIHNHRRRGKVGCFKWCGYLVEIFLIYPYSYEP